MEYNKRQYRVEIIKALGLFSTLTVIFTYPLVLKIAGYIPGFHSSDECYGALWNFWWLKYSWQKHIFDCPPIAIPFGMQPCESGYPLWNAINKWLSILTGNIFAYNIQVLGGYLLSGLFVYALVYHLAKDKKCAFFSGIIYAFCPYHIVRTWQHLGLSMIQWIPLYLLGLVRIKDKPGFKNTLFAAMALFLVFSFDLYYVYFMFIVTVLFFAFLFLFAWKKKIKAPVLFKNDWEAAQKIILCGFIVFLFVSPTIYSTVMSSRNYSRMPASAHNPYLRPFEDLFAQSAKPLGYLLPASTHPVLGALAEGFVGSSWYGESFTEHTLYLGWVPLILAFMALRRWRAGRKEKQGQPHLETVPANEDFYIGFFLSLAVVAWLFSQPPWWNIFGFKLYMPSFFMYKILPMYRAYCRFGIVVMLAIAVLAGFGLKFFLERFKSRKAGNAVFALFCGLVLFEFWNYPSFKVIDVSKVPAVYYWLKNEPHDTIIAEYPLDIDGANELYKFYQTVHEKPMINGTIPGTDANIFANRLTDLSDLNTAVVLNRIGVKYALVHRQAYLDTELTRDKEELDKIPQNSGLKLVRSFPAETCPDENIICTQRTGPIDVYQVK